MTVIGPPLDIPAPCPDIYSSVSWTELLINLESEIVGEAVSALEIPAPLLSAKLSVNEHPLMMGDPYSQNIPPPLEASFTIKLQLATVGELCELYIPPPMPAELSLKMQLTITGEDELLNIPPPLELGKVDALAFPRVIVNP